MIRTPPLAVRNRLAEMILEALHDPDARRALAALAVDTPRGADRLGAVAPGEAAIVRERARRASEALAALPLAPRAPSIEDALAGAAALFDAGLYFEVHELLEPYWARAAGELREALQGLIQIAVGYQHLANDNLAGAEALLGEGGRRLAGRSLAGLDLEAFARAVRGSMARLPDLPPGSVPRFPRRAERGAGRD